MTVSEKLCNYAAGLHFEDLSAEVAHEAKRVLLDTLGLRSPPTLRVWQDRTKRSRRSGWS